MPDPQDDLFGMPPLDLGEATGPQATLPSAPSSRARAKEFAPLLALLPIVAAKGGRAGVAALLQGFSQMRQQNQTTQRQDAQDAERQRQTAEQERHRRATLAQTTASNDALRRQQLIASFTGGLEGLESEEAARAYLQLFGPQAQAVGLRPETLEPIALEAVAPSRLQKKEATKVIEQAKKQYGDQAVSHSYALKDGTQATWEELNRRAGVTLGPTVPKTDVPNTLEEQQVADEMAVAAEKSGRALTRAEAAKIRQQVHQQWTEAGRRPEQPSAGTDPKKIATFNQIAGAFERSPLVRAADRTVVLSDAVKEIDANPSDPATQLKLAYAYIQALDTYQSAVREGELQNLGMLGTRLQQWVTTLNKVAFEGAFIPPAVAKNISQSAKQLVQTIDAGRKRKAQEFRSRAQVSGVGDMWDQFVAGSVPTEPPPPARPSRPPGQNPFRR